MDTRIRRIDAHDDGVNAWSMAHIDPADELAGDFRSYCDYTEKTSGFTSRRELPHGEGVLIFNLREEIVVTAGNGLSVRLGAGEAFVAGVHLRPALSSSGGRQSGIQVELPLSTLRRLLKVPMDRLCDQVVRLDDLLGAPARALGRELCEAGNREERIGILERALASLAKAKALDGRVVGAIEMLRNRPDLDIVAIADCVGWSRKHLADRMRDTVGVGPRTFRRLLRFQKLTRRISARPVTDWASCALDAGYCDQSHLIREFREFAGITPSEFAVRILFDGGGLVER